jgi:hypothetical protein
VTFVGHTGEPNPVATAAGVGFAVGAGNVCAWVHPAITIHRINELAMRSIPKDFLIEPDLINFPDDFTISSSKGITKIPLIKKSFYLNL